METVVLETTAPWDGHPDCWRKSSLVNWQLLNQKETILGRKGENQFTKWNLFECILKIHNLSWLSTEPPTFWSNHYGPIQAERMLFLMNQIAKNFEKMLGDLDLLARM